MGIEISDASLLKLLRLDPMCVPIPLVHRCLELVGEDRAARQRLLESLPKRRPRTAKDHRELLRLALDHAAGMEAAVMEPAALAKLVDRCGGFGEKARH